MSIENARKGMTHYEQTLSEKARQLVEVLDSGDMGTAMVLIQELNDAKHQAFYNEVGFLTRGLHEAIKSFSDDVGNALQDSESVSSVFSDASERLSYVIEVTDKNAHDTMDRVDTALTLVDRLDNQSERFQELLSLVGQLEAEFDGLRGVYDRTCQLKEESEQTITDLRSQLTDILVSQSYQDITGQLIRRVINLVTNVESHLVGLMEMASKVESMSNYSFSQTQLAEAPVTMATKSDSNEPEQKEQKKPVSEVKAEGPQIGSSPDVASNQDDVDELLSSLGF